MVELKLEVELDCIKTANTEIYIKHWIFINVYLKTKYDKVGTLLNELIF